jgi:hypothetical protein
LPKLTGKIPREPRAATGVVIGREVKLPVSDGNAAAGAAQRTASAFNSKLISVFASVGICELALNSRARIPQKKYSLPSK